MCLCRCLCVRERAALGLELTREGRLKWPEGNEPNKIITVVGIERQTQQQCAEFTGIDF